MSDGPDLSAFNAAYSAAMARFYAPSQHRCPTLKDFSTAELQAELARRQAGEARELREYLLSLRPTRWYRR